MPELPEVELVCRSLDKLVRGRRIVRSELLRARLAPETEPAIFESRLSNATIELVHRRGKHILVGLDNGHTLIVHLRMSGRFSLLAADRDDPKFTHAVFHFDDEQRLVFDDQRHFGMMKVVATDELLEAKELKKLAPEPFSSEFSPEYFRRTLKTSKRCIKEFLLDQTKVCGLGNIYASEALFSAAVHPETPANKLGTKKITRLYESIRDVLQTAIAHTGGLGIDPEEIMGGYFGDSADENWLVYDRESEPCRNCETPIIRLKQAGRSTYFCRRCQRK